MAGRRAIMGEEEGGAATTRSQIIGGDIQRRSADLGYDFRFKLVDNYI